MLSFQEEPFSRVASEIAAIMHAHWAEVSDSDEPLDVDWDRFFELDRLGIVHVLTARHHGELVGYVVLLTCHALHYRTKLIAHDDAFFLKKEHRKGLAAVRMFRRVEEMMKAKGVHRIVYHEKRKVPSGKVFKFLGYAPTETYWMKDIT